ncbi:MAG: hypothetical protein HGA93_06300, partial [Methanothrix sp.]|nr:hypothetical protein [Methanothrix sp.]
MQQSGAETGVSDLPPSAQPPASNGAAEKPKITVIDYDEQHYHEAEVK